MNATVAMILAPAVGTYAFRLVGPVLPALRDSPAIRRSALLGAGPALAVPAGVPVLAGLIVHSSGRAL